MDNPPFCPNKFCSNYSIRMPIAGWYVRDGHYRSGREAAVQRFRCKKCGRHFSSQTFSLDYMTRRRISYSEILKHLCTSSGIRDISRILHCSTRTVTNRISRLARQAIAIHAELTNNFQLHEDLVADGFESFTLSQYFPNNIHLLAGKESQFWFLSDYSHLRRKGRMTPWQARRNKELKSQFIYNRITIYESFNRLVNYVLRLQMQASRQCLNLYTDEHTQYRRVLNSLTPRKASMLKHVRCSSRSPRNVSNPLFSVNYLDREIRKDSAEHTRETVQFARNSGNSMERLAIYRLYHNYMKPFRINGKDHNRLTHAEKAGIPKKQIETELTTLYLQRRFLQRTRGISGSDTMVWLRGFVTPLKATFDYLPRYAWD